MKSIIRKNKFVSILSIAGSDNSAGAGIQSDIKTAQSLGCYCFTAITCVTSQNSDKVYKIQNVSNDIILSQIKSIFNNYKIDAIKIGLLPNLGVIDSLKKLLSQKKLPLVVDPIFKSTTGQKFMEHKNYVSIYNELSSLASVYTPNYYEAQLLLNEEVNTLKNKLLLKKIHELYKIPIVLTGVSNEKINQIDYLIEGGKISELKVKRLDSKSTHGTGCCFSTALAINLARGYGFVTSVKNSQKQVLASIMNSHNFGVKYGPIGH